MTKITEKSALTALTALASQRVEINTLVNTARFESNLGFFVNKKGKVTTGCFTNVRSFLRGASSEFRTIKKIVKVAKSDRFYRITFASGARAWAMDVRGGGKNQFTDN